MPRQSLPYLLSRMIGGLQYRLSSKLYPPLFRLLEGLHIHILPDHYYYPIPNLRELRKSGIWNKTSELAGIDMNETGQLDLLCSVFPQYQAEYNAIPLHGSPDMPAYQFHYHNGAYDFTDAGVLYCMVRHYKPRLVLEVGSGWSTRLTALAARLNGNTQVICIEPYPPHALKGEFPGLTKLIEKRVEEIDRVMFEQLEAGDILFIDSSHVVKTGGDVNYLYLDILPRLKKGVLVHVHDIFLPEEYPKFLMDDHLWFWSEQYLLQAFLMYNTNFKVLFANHYMALKHPDKLKAAFPICGELWSASSFWMQVI